MQYKNYEIKVDKPTTNYTIHSVGKGALPKVLSGLFTSPKIAQTHIDRYLANKEPIKE